LPPRPMTNIFLARQPILDRGQPVVGYELLYRGGDVERALVDDQALATARVALNALTGIGLEHLVGQSVPGSTSRGNSSCWI
jgi:EAL and modified HD-GYP domain-containing signal transduction protein